jgi:predicted metal-binding membrane protein
MSAPATQRRSGGDGLAPAFAAARARIGLVVLLFALAGVGWWWTIGRMRSMDDGPWTGFGSFGWFLTVWVVMMAAMMFPSVSPMVALYSRMTKARSALLPLLFTAGYLLAWAGAGAVAFAARAGVDAVSPGALAWDRTGRWVAGATLVLAAAYQLTPLKDVCLGKCRSPLGALLGSWRDGPVGSVRMGVKNGLWCVGCCWALMASLFALGVMSVAWMAVVAAMIAAEKTLPWRRIAAYGTAAVLLVLGVLLLVAPGAVPGLTTPHGADMEMSAGS